MVNFKIPCKFAPLFENPWIMRFSIDRKPYFAPQSETIDFQIESSFMNGTVYSGTYTLGNTQVEEGDEL